MSIAISAFMLGGITGYYSEVNTTELISYAYLNMTIGESGLNLIKSFEGCRLTAYKISGEANYTIGYGHNSADVYAGMKITQSQADAYLRQDLKKAESQVNSFLNKNNITVNQNQFDALVSFTFNLGNIWIQEEPFQLRTYLINGVSNYTSSQITAAFTNWNKGSNHKVMEGLTRRRKAEAELFLSGTSSSTISKTIDSNYKQPITVTANHKIDTYDEYGNKESGRYIDSGDSCYIEAVYTSGFVKVQYPTSSGKRCAYAKRDDFSIPKVDTKWYSGKNTVDIGNIWYGYIIYNKDWKPLTNDGGNVSFRSGKGAYNQLWRFTKNTDGSYKITSLADGQVLDVVNGSSEKGTNICVWGDNNGSANQKWFIYGSSGNHYLRSACTDCVLDLSSGTFSEGVNAQTWEYGESNTAQRFALWGLNEAPKLAVNAGNSATKTKFTWSYEGDGAKIVDHVDLKIWKGKIWDGDAYTIAWNEKGTSKELVLPAGHYEAYIDRSTPLSSSSDPAKMSNVVSFDIKDATFNVTFNANGGSVSNGNKTVTYNATYGELPTPTRTGYTFNGWYTSASGGNKVDANTKVTITGNQTLYAQWKAKSVSVKFFRNNDKNDTANVTETFTYGVSNQKFGYKTDGTARYSPMNSGNVGFGAWAKTGYEMLGWSSDRNAKSAEYSIYSGVSNDWIDSKSPSVNRYAIWKAKQYTITFNANGGNVSTDNKIVTYDSTYSELPTPTRTGYTFNGWYTSASGGDKVDSNTKVKMTPANGKQTLYAQWKVNKYTVTFNANGGSISNGSKTVTYDSTYGDLPTPTKTGYTFIGWYNWDVSLGDKIDANTKVIITENHKLYAHWEKEMYSIGYSYESNGKYNECDMMLSYYDKYGELPNPTKKGYTFVGWFSEKTGGIQITSDMTLIVAVNHSLYDHWKANNYTVTFNANGGSVSNGNKTVTYDSIYGELPTPTRTGYTFNGWYTSASGGNKVDANTKVTITENQTLYAQWKTTNIKGDANGDGIVNVSDAVMLQKWLLCSGDLTKWKNVDLCEDGRIDVFDMVEMRKLLVQNK